MTRFVLAFLFAFLLTSACGLVTVWADSSQWGSGRAGDIMGTAFMFGILLGLCAGAAVMDTKK